MYLPHQITELVIWRTISWMKILWSLEEILQTHDLHRYPSPCKSCHLNSCQSVFTYIEPNIKMIRYQFSRRSMVLTILNNGNSLLININKTINIIKYKTLMMVADYLRVVAPLPVEYEIVWTKWNETNYEVIWTDGIAWVQKNKRS